VNLRVNLKRKVQTFSLLAEKFHFFKSFKGLKPLVSDILLVLGTIGLQPIGMKTYYWMKVN
jgi:hypothetical protein